MYNSQQSPEISISDRKVLDFFAQDAFPPVEANADDLVTVKMTSRFELTEVRISKDAVPATEAAMFEQAILKAVNEAIRHVAELNGKRLNEFSANLQKD